MPSEEKKDQEKLESWQNVQAYQIGQLQGRFARLDKTLEKLQYVLYGILLGLIIAEIARL